MIDHITNQKMSPTSTVGAREYSALPQKFSITVQPYVLSIGEGDERDHDDDAHEGHRHDEARRLTRHYATAPRMPLMIMYTAIAPRMNHTALRVNDTSGFLSLSWGSLRSSMRLSLVS